MHTQININCHKFNDGRGQAATSEKEDLLGQGMTLLGKSLRPKDQKSSARGRSQWKGEEHM
jgi:hypothetical protein